MALANDIAANKFINVFFPKVFFDSKYPEFPFIGLGRTTVKEEGLKVYAVTFNFA